MLAASTPWDRASGFVGAAERWGRFAQEEEEEDGR